MRDALMRLEPVALSILRIMTALLFLEHGLMKLLEFPVQQPGAPHPLPTLLVAAALIETIGGVLLLLGILTRAVAFVASGQMAVAYFVAHAPQGPWPGANQGDAAILFCFVFLFLIFAGGGSIGLDAARARASVDRQRALAGGGTRT